MQNQSTMNNPVLAFSKGIPVSFFYPPAYEQEIKTNVQILAMGHAPVYHAPTCHS